MTITSDTDETAAVVVSPGESSGPIPTDSPEPAVSAPADKPEPATLPTAEVPTTARDAHAAALTAEQTAAETLAGLDTDANAGRDVDPDALIRARTVLDLAQRKVASLADAAAAEGAAATHAAWEREVETARDQRDQAAAEVNGALDALGPVIDRLAESAASHRATLDVLRQLEAVEPGVTAATIRPRIDPPTLETMIASVAVEAMRRHGLAGHATTVDLAQTGDLW